MPKILPYRGIDPLPSLLAEGRMALPDACRAIRSLQDVSQDEFAKRIGVNRKVIKLLESGKGNPRHESLERIARSAGLRIAFVADRPVVGLMNSRKRLSEENAQRDADAKALKQGMPQKTMYQRNAMRLGDVKLKLPKIG
jgi:transcriptional regulator with XRE-family HTH domain